MEDKGRTVLILPGFTVACHVLFTGKYKTNSCKTDNFCSRTKYILNHKPDLCWTNTLWESREYTCISIRDMDFFLKGKSFFEE